jgi:hypothetical protein
MKAEHADTPYFMLSIQLVGLGCRCGSFIEAEAVSRSPSDFSLLSIKSNRLPEQSDHLYLLLKSDWWAEVCGNEKPGGFEAHG